jgi:hypothetical protein
MLYSQPVPGRFQFSSFLAAICLGATTMAVFSSLQNYGPESVLRRFHQALNPNQNGELDWNAIAQTVDQPTQSVAVQKLVSTVRQLLRNGPPRIAGMQRELVQSRQPNLQVRELLVYHDIDNSSFPIVWIIERQSGQWRINVQKTETVLMDMFGG